MGRQRDDYEDMAVTVLRVREDSILVDYDGNESWVPLSLCDDRARALGEDDVDEEVEIGIEVWKCKDLGWL